ncbi:MAG: hypothetical protein LBQ68_08080, partial [Clostridiales bacterium]|nr:hypothetical protein [Clostridiales bacterium]
MNERVKRLLNFKKHSRIIIIIAVVVLVAVLIVCCGENRDNGANNVSVEAFFGDIAVRYNSSVYAYNNLLSDSNFTRGEQLGVFNDDKDLKLYKIKGDNEHLIRELDVIMGSSDVMERVPFSPITLSDIEAVK